MRALVFFGSVGAVNSLRKQYYEDSRVTAAELTDRGFNNLQKSFAAYLAGYSMRSSGNAVNDTAARFFLPIIGFYFVGTSMVLAGTGAGIYGHFKLGEGIGDLLQSLPKLDNFSQSNSLSK